MKRHGFTILELIIVITIMGILMIIGVVNMSASLVNGRDAERKSDASAIAQNLETFYTSGYDNDINPIGRYPSTHLVDNLTSMHTMLRDVDDKSLEAPGITDPTVTFIDATCSGTCVQTTAGVTPQPTKDQYVYQPLQADGTLCTDDSTQECVEFNLYYRLEADNTVYMITSKHQ